MRAARSRCLCKRGLDLDRPVLSVKSTACGRQSNYAACGGGVEAGAVDPDDSLSAPPAARWCRFWCRLEVENRRTQSKSVEVPIPGKCRSDSRAGSQNGMTPAD